MDHQTTDVLHGIAEIARHLGFRTNRQAYHAVASGHVPAFKLGGKWCARKSTLDEFFAEKERAALAGKGAA
jgi:hypothetical protein